MTTYNLEQLIAEAKARFEALSPEEQARHRKAQRLSWVKGEMLMGDDRQEVAEREALRQSKTKDSIG